MPTLQMDSRQLSYYDSGSGFPLVFLHSFGHGKLMWMPQLYHFSYAGYRVIAPDLNGHGESTLRVESCSMEGMADDVCELLSSLRIQRAVVIGISMGGYIALKIWESKPNMVRALVLSNTKAESDTDDIRKRRMEQIRFIREQGVKSFVETHASRRLSKKTLETRPWVLDMIQMMNLLLTPEALSASLQAIADRRDDSSILPTISVPTLITTGSDDIHMPKSSGGLLNEAIRGSRLLTMEGTAHVSSLEDPESYNRAVSDFLRTVL